MFDEPNEAPDERAFDPQQRATEKAGELRMHAELYAVYEGGRKFDAKLNPRLDADTARDIQKRIAKLEKAKSPETPVLPPAVAAEAAALLNLSKTLGLSTNDYHVSRRPGEALIVRWLEGDQVESFYKRMQAHLDVALEQLREDERQAHQWKQDEKISAYLDELDKVQVPTGERYLREVIQKHRVYVLSTVTADEMDILHLCDFMMGVPAGAVVGPASAPPEDPTEQDRAWFFKLFSLRGMPEGVEKMCFFTYLQKAEDTFGEL